MTATNPFVLEGKEYVRDIAFLRHYVEDVARFLSISSGDSIEKTTAFVKAGLKKGGIFEFKDPKITYLERINYNDRVKKEGTLLQYIADSVKNEEIIAPTFTTYINPKIKKSLLVDFVDENIASRSKAKKEMFAAELAGLIDLQAFKSAEQSNAKIANNAISGAHVSSSTILYNRTAHSTLTSNCRITSGYGNANNEKMLSGNRHYYHPNVVVNSIVSIANRTDLDKLEKVMAKYNLHYPTAEEAMGVVLNSINFYWRAAKQEKAIFNLLSKMRPIELAAFVYVSDLYQLAKFNDKVMRDLVTRLGTPYYGEHPDALKVIFGNRKEYAMLAVQLLPDHMRGINWEKIACKPDPKKPLDQELARIKKELVIAGYMANTILNISSTVDDHADLIEALLVTINVPSSLAYFPTSIRKSALTSDTDSTIFTVQDWVKWSKGNYVVNNESKAVAAVMVFLAAETITHILANMSANLGIETKRIHTVNMKNEFFFPAFIPTQVGKHYFANISCQEGNLKIEYEMEVKGVHLKSSNVPAVVMDKAKDMMKYIMDTAESGEQISIAQLLNEVAEVERDITASILAGENKYLRSQQINSPEAYTKGEEESPYRHYVFWEKIFADKYGHTEPPPYSVAKVPMYLPNARSIKKWLDSIEDPVIKSRMIDFFAETKRKSLNTVYLPQQRLLVHGIPLELVPALDMRRVILDMCSVFYILLECLGVSMLDDRISQLISDYH